VTLTRVLFLKKLAQEHNERTILAVEVSRMVLLSVSVAYIDLDDVPVLSTDEYKVNLTVVLVGVGTALAAGNCTACHLLDTSRLTVETVADILAHSSEKEGVAVE
jgi:hypothetical protein